MSVFMCADVRDLAPELAVNIVGGAERAEALQHMSGCGPCRALVAELSDAADALTLLAAEAEPPAGFERRVLASIGARKRRSWRRTLALAAAVVAATAIVSIVGVRLVEGSDQQPVVAPAASGSVTTVAMRNPNGIDVGELLVSDGHPAVVMVTVDYLIADGTYFVELQSPQRDSERIGEIQVTDGRGSFGGTSKLPPQGTITVVDSDGKERCTAELPTVH